MSAKVWHEHEVALRQRFYVTFEDLARACEAV